MSGTVILGFLDSIGLSFWNYLAWQQVIWLQTALWEPAEPDDDPGGGTRLRWWPLCAATNTTYCSLLAAKVAVFCLTYIKKCVILSHWSEKRR